MIYTWWNVPYVHETGLSHGTYCQEMGRLTTGFQPLYVHTKWVGFTATPFFRASVPVFYVDV